MNSFIRAAAASAILASAALPAAASAASVTNAPPQHYAFQTQLTDRFHPGAYTGTLTLTVYPDGIVNGVYRADDGAVREVVGGIDGTSIWLDVDASVRRLHLIGTLQNGVLRTYANTPGTDWEFDSVGNAPGAGR